MRMRFGITVFRLSTLALLPWVLSAASPLAAQAKENLDLPYDAVGESEEEEEAPEVVSFYNVNLEGDAFFYVIDKSGSMETQGELARAKQECMKNLREFSDRVWFGIVFFDSEVLRFPANGQPTQASPGMKAQANRFIQAASRGHGSCPKEGMLAGLRMANLAKPKRKVVVYLGDGGGHCGRGVDPNQYLKEALKAITGANYQRARINTIGVLDVYPEGEVFLKQLAAQNGGTYTRIR